MVTLTAAATIATSWVEGMIAPGARSEPSNANSATVTDVFISYATEDRGPAAKLASALGALGWSVWWDRNIVSAIFPAR
jgi:hypothetical protein